MATQYMTDKNMSFRTRKIYKSEKMPGAVTMTAADRPSVRGFLGFGVAITGASCYLLNQMTESERTAFLKSIYSSDGLGLSVGRLSIGSSDYSAELYTYDDVPFDTDLVHFSVKRDEEYVIPMIKEILKIKPDLYLFASPWSPPGWMKTGGCICGGYMRDEYVECYADYVVKFIKAYAEYGIKISAITPQNEPETQQAGRMPACIWHPETEAKYIKALKKKLAENGLDVKVWMYDNNFPGIDRVLWTLDSTDGLPQCCDGVAFHYYKGHPEQTVKLNEKYPELELHFTEGGPRLFDNYDTDWCKWSTMIARALKCGYKSFTGWNLMLDETGGPNIGPFFCGGLVTRKSDTGELSVSGQYKAYEHIAKHITENSVIYPLISDESVQVMSSYPKTNIPVDGFMIDNGDGRIVFVMINSCADKKQVKFFAKDNWWYAELLADSVSTVEF